MENGNCAVDDAGDGVMVADVVCDDRPTAPGSDHQPVCTDIAKVRCSVQSVGLGLVHMIQTELTRTSRPSYTSVNRS